VQSSIVLVTGGAGFIGSHLVDTLMGKGFRVRVVDNLSSGSLGNIEHWLSTSGFELVRGDLKDPDTAARSMDDVDLVFHLAANPDVRTGETDPSVHFRENLLTTFNLLEAMRQSKNARSIVFASTSTIYGEATTIPTPEEYGPLLPISVYGASKLGCESLIASYCHTYRLRGALLRFANVVGLRSSHGVISDFVQKLRKNPEELEILGDGNQTKSYLHIRDLVSALFVVLDSLGRPGSVEAYNVGSLDQASVKRIAHIVVEEMHLVKPRFRFNDLLSDGRGWKGDVRNMQLSVEKLVKLGWAPSMQSEDAVRLCCKEMLAT